MLSTSIIFIHGLWMNGMDMTLLSSRFKKHGYSTSRFRYPSVKQTPRNNAHRLAEYINCVKSDRVHIVCHSLGGLVLRHCLDLHPSNKIGNIVMLGTPNQTSAAAKTLTAWPGGRLLLGKSIDNGLLGPLPDWSGNQKIGIIAGDLRIGMGLLIPNIPRPSDGTVAIKETRLPGMSDHITLPVSHFGLLFSKQVFEQTRHFIEHAHFIHT